MQPSSTLLCPATRTGCMNFRLLEREMAFLREPRKLGNPGCEKRESLQREKGPAR